jgi:hypothetical protein
MDERSVPPDASAAERRMRLTTTFKARIVPGPFGKQGWRGSFLFFNILALLGMTDINGLIEKDNISMRPPAGTPAAGTEGSSTEAAATLLAGVEQARTGT